MSVGCYYMFLRVVGLPSDSSYMDSLLRSSQFGCRQTIHLELSSGTATQPPPSILISCRRELNHQAFLKLRALDNHQNRLRSGPFWDPSIGTPQSLPTTFHLILVPALFVYLR